MPTEQVSTGLDLSLVIAIAALILSALSPLISSLVNGHFRIKEKKLDITEKQLEQERDFYYPSLTLINKKEWRKELGEDE